MQKIRIWAVLCVCCLAVGAFGYTYRAVTAVVPAWEPVQQLPTILIDPGHGGFDGGAVGVDGVVEKDVNLAIALKLRDLFTACGFDTVLTRQGDEALGGEEGSTRQRKNADLHQRMALTEEYPDGILLSIHQNYYGDPQAFGAQVFYGPQNPESRRLGETMQQYLVGQLQPENTRQAKECTQDVYLIHNAQVPCLLVECGFLSNPQDTYRLIQSDYQKRVAFSIFSGVCAFLELGESALPTAKPEV